MEPEEGAITVPPASGRVDPRNLDKIANIMNSKTFKVYKSSWLEFINIYDITIEKEPEESDFQNYFARKRSLGCSGNSIKCIYSHLNKVYGQLYNIRLSVSSIN